MTALRIVEHLDIVKDILPSFVPAAIDFALYPFAPQRLEEDFSGHVVMSITASAHPLLQIINFQHITPVTTAELAAFVYMYEHIF